MMLWETYLDYAVTTHQPRKALHLEKQDSSTLKEHGNNFF